MIASDLPEAGHATAHAMAATLASYMPNPAAVRRAVLAEFGHAPSHGEIASLRCAALIRRMPKRPEKVSALDRYDAGKASRDAAEVNREFLTRLAFERLGWAKQ